MLVVQPGRRHSGDEELAAVAVDAAVGHGQREGPVMPQRSRKFIPKLCSPNARPTSAVTCGLQCPLEQQPVAAHA